VADADANQADDQRRGDSGRPQGAQVPIVELVRLVGGRGAFGRRCSPENVMLFIPVSKNPPKSLTAGHERQRRIQPTA
jgi:hypothetical protein